MDRLANEGLKLIEAGKYDEGIERLSKVLEDRPAPHWLIERSKAYLRTKQLDLALHDAETALSVAFKRANRDYMAEAQLRRAITLFRMGRYADADICAFWVIRLVDGAPASEDDGQQRLVDAQGNYTVTLEEVKAKNAEGPAKRPDMQEAMGRRTRSMAMKDQANAWRLQALGALDRLPANDAGRKVNAVKYPDPSAAPLQKPSNEGQEPDGRDEPPKAKVPDEIRRAIVGEDSPEKVWQTVWQGFRAMQAKNVVRTDFYQSDSSLTVSLYVKNVSKDDLKVDCQARSISLHPIPSVPSGSIKLALFSEVDPAKTQYTVKSMKIELVLKKASFIKWPYVGEQSPIPSLNLSTFRKHAESLGFTDPKDLTVDKYNGDSQKWYNDLVEKLEGPPPSTNTSADSGASTQKASQTAQPVQATQPVQEAQPAPPKPAAADAAHSYPTSSKHGAKNWDALGDDDEEEEKGEDVNDFFKKIYSSGDEDMKRAMMKSFVESNGTALSTDWKEASSKKYDTLPPDGAEAKEY